MKIYYIAIFKNETKDTVELTSQKDLASFNYFTRGSIGEFMTFFSGEIAGRTRPGQRQSVQQKDEYVCHAYGRPEGICGTVVADQEYDAKAAHALLSKICDEFVSKYPRTSYANFTPASRKADSNLLPFPELKDYIVKWQDPAQADSLTKIQRELDETKIVLHKTIESVLERGEKIDTLVAKSDGLSAQSKMFYTQAKKQNSCCIIM